MDVHHIPNELGQSLFVVGLGSGREASLCDAADLAMRGIFCRVFGSMTNIPVLAIVSEFESKKKQEDLT